MRKNERTVTIELKKAIAIFATSLLGVGAGAFWAGLTTLNSDHFTIISLAGDVDDLKANKIDINTYNAEQKHIMDKLETISKSIENLSSKLDRHLEK